MVVSETALGIKKYETLVTLGDQAFETVTLDMGLEYRPLIPVIYDPFRTTVYDFQNPYVQSDKVYIPKEFFWVTVILINPG